jgi:hypothetical protein
MLNKGVLGGKPFAVLGPFWQPILDCVREVEMGPSARRWGEAHGKLVYRATSAEEAAGYVDEKLQHANGGK